MSERVILGWDNEWEKISKENHNFENIFWKKIRRLKKKDLIKKDKIIMINKKKKVKTMKKEKERKKERKKEKRIKNIT